MRILTFDEMVMPVLQYIADGQEYQRILIINMLAEHFSLTQDERNRLSKSGKMEVTLSRKDLIEKTKLAHYRITSLGLELLNHNSEAIPTLDMNTETGIDSSTSSTNSTKVTGNTPTPEKSIEKNYQQIRKELATELLQKISENTPTFFEELVIDLLVAMGYGGSREDAGKAVGGSGDGGIDGIINEDKLGLDVIYVQAKRWESNIGEPPLRDFVGALDGKGVQKGIFITTSNFNPAAENYAERSSKRIILIDGNQLAQYMIDHNVGVSIEKTYEIKRVDSDYFAENTNDS